MIQKLPLSPLQEAAAAANTIELICEQLSPAAKKFLYLSGGMNYVLETITQILQPSEAPDNVVQFPGR